jgi:peptidoglycan/LPS O-acetylase OafA/YrhL
MQPGDQEIYPLTSLRFLAASLVVFEHMQMLPGLEWLGFKNAFPGTVGVRVFFILSGFILSYTYGNRDWARQFGSNALDFYWSRFARIYPLHWLMFLLALPLGLNSNTARVVTANFPWLLSLTDKLWPGFDAGPQPVKAAWTLSCEFLFYFSTPLLFWFLALTKKPLLAAVLVLVAYTGTMLAVTDFFPQYNWTAYLEMPQFLLGIAGFQFARRVNFSRWSGRLIIVGVLLLVVAGLLDAPLKRWETVSWLTRVLLAYCAYAPGALLIILGCANASGMVGKFMSQPWLVLLGHASFALYLLHDPALRYLKVLLNRKQIVLSLPAGIFTTMGMFFLITIASILCFKCYENPMRLKLRSWMKARRPLPAAP